MARNDILKKLLKEAEESAAEDKVETAEEEKKADEIKDEKLVDDAAKAIEDNHVVGGTDVAGDEPDTLPKELVKEDLAAEGEMEHTTTDKPVEKEETGKEELKTKAAEERAEDHLTAAADIAGDKGDELPKDMVKEGTVVEDSLAITDNPVANQAEKVEELTDKAKDELANDKVIIVKKAETVAEPVIPASTDANPMGKVIESNEVKVEPEQQLEPGVKHADSELETTSDAKPAEKSDEVSKDETINKAAEERAEDHVASASDTATDEGDKLTKEQGEVKDRVEQFEESFTDLINFLKEENEIMTTPEQQLEPGVKHADSELETEPNTKVADGEASKETIKDATADDRAEDHLTAAADIAGDKGDELPKELVKEENEIDTVPEQQLEPGVKHADSELETDTSAVEKGETTDTELKAKVAEERAEDHVTAATDIATDEPDTLPKELVKEDLAAEGEMEHTADDKPADKAEQCPEELKAKVAEERNEDHVSAATDVEGDKPDCLCPEMVDEKYKSLKEAASLGKAYYRNPEHKAKLVTECALLSAKEAKDLIYEEYRKTVSKADMLKESLIAKYGKLAARRADIFLSRGLTEEYNPQRKLFDKLNEQIVINNIDRKIQLLEDSDVIFRNDDEIYAESVTNLDRDDIASGYAAANIITEGTGFKAKFLKFGVKFLPEAKLRSTLTKIYSGAVEKANGNEAILKNIEKYNPEGKSKEEMQMLFNSLIDLCGTNVADLEEKAKETVESNKESVDGTVKESATVAGFTILALAFVGLLCTGTFIVKAVNALLNKSGSINESYSQPEDIEIMVEDLSDLELLQMLQLYGYEPTFENANIIRQNYDVLVLDESVILTESISDKIAEWRINRKHKKEEIAKLSPEQKKERKFNLAKKAAKIGAIAAGTAAILGGGHAIATANNQGNDAANREQIQINQEYQNRKDSHQKKGDKLKGEAAIAQEKANRKDENGNLYYGAAAADYQKEADEKNKAADEQYKARDSVGTTEKEQTLATERTANAKQKATDIAHYAGTAATTLGAAAAAVGADRLIKGKNKEKK